VGPFEVTTQAILIDIYGVASGAAEAYAIALHALLLGPVIVVGFVLLWATQLSLSDILGVSASEGAIDLDESTDNAQKVVVPRQAAAPPASE
jgi:hypothetical protein